jgi:hypothetical protein
MSVTLGASCPRFKCQWHRVHPACPRYQSYNANSILLIPQKHLKNKRILFSRYFQAISRRNFVVCLLSLRCMFGISIKMSRSWATHIDSLWGKHLGARLWSQKLFSHGKACKVKKNPFLLLSYNLLPIQFSCYKKSTSPTPQSTCTPPPFFLFGNLSHSRWNPIQNCSDVTG